MTFNPKVPPVYKPTSQKVAAPPIYRPQQANHSSAQLKPAANFRMETRATPPVYQPRQSQTGLQPKSWGNTGVEIRPAPPVYRPQAASAQRYSAPGPGNFHSVSKTLQMTPNVVQCAAKSLKNLGCYRRGLLTEVESAFQKQGYHIGNMKKAILKGLTAWGKEIPGHCSSKDGKDSGEQGDTGPMCEEARDYLVTWVASNPAPTTSTSSGSSHTTTTTTTSGREERRERRKVEKREAYEERTNSTTEYIPPWKEGGASSFYKPAWMKDMTYLRK